MERNGVKAYDVVERISSYDVNHERGEERELRIDGKWGKRGKTILQEKKREEKEGKTVFYCWISLA